MTLKLILQVPGLWNVLALLRVTNGLALKD